MFLSLSTKILRILSFDPPVLHPVTLSIPLMIKPTVVDDHRVVSKILVASSDQHTCHLEEHGI